MTHRVKYLNRTTGEEYWRTVHADDDRELQVLARRYERKGFIWTTIITEQGGL